MRDKPIDENDLWLTLFLPYRIRSTFGSILSIAIMFPSENQLLGPTENQKCYR